MRVIKLGNPTLTATNADIVFPWAEARAVADGMFEVMYAEGGVGLAAPQVGINLRLFVFDSGTSQGVMCNPTLTPDKSGGRDTANEGCLSVPNFYTPKPRWNHVDVDGFDLDGNPQSWGCEGLEARIMQHECDHLAGRLCLTRPGSGVSRRAKVVTR